MKKLYLLLFMLLSAGVSRAQTCSTTIAAYPYFQNFESGAGGWVVATASSNPSWALGTPAGTIINSAASGTNSWVTNLTGNYNASENSQVLSPCFNFSTLSVPVIEMKIWWHSETSWDGAALQSSINGGQTWQLVGTYQAPNNWYNDNSLDGRAGGQDIGWAGTASGVASGGWVTAKHVLTGLGGQSNVRLRIAFGSDASVHYEGFAFDDVAIYESPAIDMGVTAIVSPNSGCSLTNLETVTVTVKNFGSATQSNIPVSYTINGGTPVSEVIAGPVAPNASATYSFTAKANLSTVGTYTIVARTNSLGDGVASNDAFTKVVTAIPNVSTFPYFQNFESGNGGWVASGTNSSWALGTPAGTVINSAASGSNAWVTNLTGDYNASENSQVMAPCFNFSSLTAPIIEMKIWWHSETSWDGAALQSSINGGQTWQLVGTYQAPNNWYNDNSLDGRAGGQDIGWAGTAAGVASGGWVTAKHVLNGLGGQSSVLLRIAFGSDASIHYEGFAFDDVRIYDTPANDAGVTAILSPTTPVTPGVSQPVQVTIRNFGTSPLTSALVGFSVNGTVVANNVPFTGNLALNQSSTPFTVGNYTFPAGNYTVKAWTRSPNGALDGNDGNDTTVVSIISCNALTGTYTIDKNSPASATSFPSIAVAVQALNSCGINSPVIFNVAPNSGPYTEVVTINAIPGASATNTITFNGNGNTIISPTAGADAVLTLNGADFVRFNNLNMQTNTSTTAGKVVSLVNGADNNIFTGCTLTHNITSTSTSHAVYVFSGSSNNTFNNNTIIGAYYGIYNYGAAATPVANNTFTNNTLRDFYYYGIYTFQSPNTLIEGNNLSRPTRTNAGFMYGIYATTGSTGLVISKNRIHNTHGAATTLTGTVYGIYVGAAGTLGSENIIKNNAIYNINNNGGSLYGFYNTGGSNTYYYHNTVSADMPGISYATLRGAWFLSASTNVRFINNNISLTSAGNTAKHAIYLGSATIALQSNGNNLYAPNGNVGYMTANRVTLADWRTATSQDANSVSADPQYVDLATGNLRPTNVALNDAGQPLASVTDDITGAPRSATTLDPGAYEFSVNPNDVGITAITGAASGCGLTATQNITVTVKNFGSAPQSNIPVNFLVNNTIIGTGTIPGPLAPNATATHTFTTTANLAAPGPYTIVANTLMTGDADPSNNTFTLNVTNSLIPTLPISLDFETPATGTGAVQVVTNSLSTITQAAGGANTGAQGMIMAGITSANWQTPVGVIDPWTNNGNQFSAIYMCINPTSGPALDSLFMTFDLKQLFKTANANTNFRVTVNGQQVGPTYRPPFDPANPATPIVWRRIRVDLTPYKNMTNVQIGLESSVKEEYAGGNGTANLVDNVMISRRVTGLKSDILASQLKVHPNPSNGIFNVTAPKGNYTIEVTDMTGRTILKQTANGTTTQLNLKDAAKGIYLMKITSEAGIAAKRLVVE